MKWTREQVAAINAKRSAVVSASAGTGKTAILTEKVVNILREEKVDIDNILIVTFSNAAAEEMKIRISGRLEEEIKREDISLSDKKRLTNQFKKIAGANIQTIHSFCYNLVKKYYYKLGLSRDFRVLNQVDVGILKTRAINKVLGDKAESKDEDFISLLSSFTGLEDDQDIFIGSYNKIFSNLYPDKWLEDKLEEYKIDEGQIPSLVKEKIINDSQDANKILESVYQDMLNSENNSLIKNSEIIKETINLTNSMIKHVEENNFSFFQNEDLSIFTKTIRFPKEFVDIRDRRNTARDILLKYSNFDLDKEVALIRKSYPLAKSFVDTILDFDKEYKARKLEENAIDFSDMEHFALKLLNDPFIANEEAENFTRVFIDEYQDTSAVQEEILSIVSKNSRLFCLGDYKQTIYGFRSSDPRIFNNRISSYKKGLGDVYNIRTNFRSSENIIDSANDVFWQIGKSLDRALRYSKDDELVYSDKLEENEETTNDIILINNSNQDISSSQAEAIAIISAIKENLGKEIIDINTGQKRKLEYKDMAILTRKLSGISDDLIEELSKARIPFSLKRSSSLFSTPEIGVFMNILDLAAGGKSDLSVISFIHHQFLGYGDEDLLKIRSIDKSKALFSNFIEYDQKREGVFISFLENIKKEVEEKSIYDTLLYIIEEVDFYDFLLSKEKGSQRIENINSFLDIAKDYDKNYRKGLNSFLEYIYFAKKSGVLISETGGSKGNSVTVSTIHRSKGLEYPLVIIPYMSRRFSTIDKNLNVSIDTDKGIGIRYYDADKRLRSRTILRDIVDDEIEKKVQEEEARLLYVAMTRAKNKLILMGQKPGSIGNISEGNSYMDWILSSLACSDEDIFSIKPGLRGKWKISEIESLEREENPLNKSIKDFAIKTKNPIERFEEDGVPDRISASEIFKDKLKKKPVFDNIPIRRGNANHAFLRLVDLNNIDSLEEERDRLVDSGHLEDGDLIDIDKIKEFFSSSIGKEILGADKVLRENKFSLLKDASLLGFQRKDKEILVQANIDLVYISNNKAYVVDYKTDEFVDPEDPSEVADKILSYKHQLLMYKEAVSKNLGLDVGGVFISFLSIPKTYKIINFSENSIESEVF